MANKAGRVAQAAQIILAGYGELMNAVDEIMPKTRWSESHKKAFLAFLAHGTLTRAELERQAGITISTAQRALFEFKKRGMLQEGILPVQNEQTPLFKMNRPPNQNEQGPVQNEQPSYTLNNRVNLLIKLDNYCFGKGGEGVQGDGFGIFATPLYINIKEEEDKKKENKKQRRGKTKPTSLSPSTSPLKKKQNGPEAPQPKAPYKLNWLLPLKTLETSALKLLGGTPPKGRDDNSVWKRWQKDPALLFEVEARALDAANPRYLKKYADPWERQLHFNQMWMLVHRERWGHNPTYLVKPDDQKSDQWGNLVLARQAADSAGADYRQWFEVNIERAVQARRDGNPGGTSYPHPGYFKSATASTAYLKWLENGLSGDRHDENGLSVVPLSQVLGKPLFKKRDHDLNEKIQVRYFKNIRQLIKRSATLKNQFAGEKLTWAVDVGYFPLAFLEDHPSYDYVAKHVKKSSKRKASGVEVVR